MPEVSAVSVKGVQGVGYVCAVLLSLVICVPMSMHQDQFRGRCLLFSTGQWQEKDGQFLVNWASQAYCNFTIFVAVIMFVISGYQFYRFIRFFHQGKDSSFLSAFLDVIVCVFMTFMTFTAALFVTLGFGVWCKEMTRRYPYCQDAEGNVMDKADNIDSSDFFHQMFTAQFGIWSSFTVWFTILVFSVVKLCRYHHEENLRVSMAKERKRLINEDNNLFAEVQGPVHTSGNQIAAATGSATAAGSAAAAADPRGPTGGGRYFGTENMAVRGDDNTLSSSNQPAVLMGRPAVIAGIGVAGGGEPERLSVIVHHQALQQQQGTGDNPATVDDPGSVPGSTIHPADHPSPAAAPSSSGTRAHSHQKTYSDSSAASISDYNSPNGSSYSGGANGAGDGSSSRGVDGDSLASGSQHSASMSSAKLHQHQGPLGGNRPDLLNLN